MEFTFKLSEQEANIALNALMNEPYIQVVDVINKLNTQAFEQRQATATKDKEEKQM